MIEIYEVVTMTVPVPLWVLVILGLAALGLEGARRVVNMALDRVCATLQTKKEFGGLAGVGAQEITDALKGNVAGDPKPVVDAIADHVAKIKGRPRLAKAVKVFNAIRGIRSFLP